MDLASYIYPFSISIKIIFVFLVKQQNNSKILKYRVNQIVCKKLQNGLASYSYNGIFITKFLKTDENEKEVKGLKYGAPV